MAINRPWLRKKNTRGLRSWLRKKNTRGLRSWLRKRDTGGLRSWLCKGIPEVDAGLGHWASAMYFWDHH